MRRIIVRLISTLVVLTAVSHAETITAVWQAQGNWTNSAIWEGGAVPGSNDLAVVKHGNVDITTNLTLDEANFGEYNTYTNGHLGKVNVLSGGSLYVTKNLTIGARDGNGGELAVSGGEVSANYVRLGGNWSTTVVDSIGTLNITDGRVLVRNYNGAEIGKSASGCVGTVNLYSGGVYEAQRIKVGSADGATGIVNVVEGTLKLTRTADADVFVMNNGVVHLSDGLIEWAGTPEKAFYWHSDIIQQLAESGDLTWGGTTTNMLFDSYTYSTNNGTSVLYSYDWMEGSVATTYVWSATAGDPLTSTTVLDYQFNDAAGTHLMDLQNDGTAGMFDANATNMLEATGAGFLKWQNASTNDGSWRTIDLGDSMVNSGTLTMEWCLDSWAMTNTASNTGIKMVLGDSNTGQEIRTVFETDNPADSMKLRMRDSTPSNRSIFDIDMVNTNGADGYVFRVINDLDAGSATFEYRTDSGTWTDLTPGSGTGLARVDWIGVQMTKGWMDNPDAFALVDYLTVTHEGLPPTMEELYENWLSRYPSIGTSTNSIDNPDGDAYDNLHEYALDGDPTDGMDVGHRVTSQLQGSYLEYICLMRDDAAVRGLSYSLLADTDLVTAPGWTNVDYEVTGTNISIGISGFNAITNRVSTDTEEVQFIKMQIEGRF